MVLALVPMVALVVQWTINSTQLYGDWQRQKERNDASNQAAGPVANAFSAVQEERRLSAAALVDPAAYRKQLSASRARTDAAIKVVERLPGSGWKAPNDLRHDVVGLGKGLRKLPDYRAGVDARTASQQQTFDRYTNLISEHLKVFTTLTNVGLPEIDRYATPAIDESSGLEMISRQDAYLTRASVTGHLSGADRGTLAGWSGAQEFIYDDKVVPLLPHDEGVRFRKFMESRAWKEMTGVEQGVLGNPAGGTYTDRFSADLGRRWRDSVQQVSAGLRERNIAYGNTLAKLTDGKVNDMRTRLITTSVFNATALLLVVVITVLTTRMLRRRISDLRSAALDLQTRLPVVVERMRKGEDVDVDAELPALDHSGDELGQLGQALNLARRTALETTVTQVGQLRGFERLLQRIARRTQLLIGLQMKKLSELERRHEDPEVLEGLFDLDHLTARLRRYEENLVILGGGQPQRRWRKPVLLLDVLRAAQSEVRDYRRIQIEAESRVWLSERAVGLVIHVLAELMENAVGFSRPPAPVEVYAARVARGLAVEIEDRGVGMDAEQYEAINRMMGEPPVMDMMTRAEDVRLGLYVVARLTQGLGIRVELRPSAFGGTRVVVLIPDELVVVDAQSEAGPEEAVTSWRVVPNAVGQAASATFGAVPPDGEGAFAADPGDDTPFAAVPHSIDGRSPNAPQRSGDALRPGLAQDTISLRMGHLSEGPVGARDGGSAAGAVQPLPKRVRQASLQQELRVSAAARAAQPDDERDPVPRALPTRSGAAIGAFQRQSRLARQTPATADHDQGAGGALPAARRTPTEDRA